MASQPNPRTEPVSVTKSSVAGGAVRGGSLSPKVPSSIVTRGRAAARKDTIGGSPSELAADAAAAMAKEWVLQPDFSSPKIPPGTAENLLASGSSAHPTFSPSEYPTSAQHFFGRRQLRKMHGQDPDFYTPVAAGHWARPGVSPDWSGKKSKKPKTN